MSSSPHSPDVRQTPPCSSDNPLKELREIPAPRGWPIIGNVAQIDQNFPLRTFGEFADQYGEIFAIRLPGGRKINIACSAALVPDLSDETRFKKNPQGALEQVRNAVNDGLFTARPNEPNWGIAHRILMPAMGPMAIRGMFDEMHDLATQLVMKWARHGPSYPIMATDDLTRVTLDTLALCSMGFRFNSYYTPEVLPFLKSMGSFLQESGRRIGRLPLPEFCYKSENEAYFNDVKEMRATAQGVLNERKREGPGGRKDLLQAMMDGVDKVTGQRMTDDSILDNLLTFLVAGHETTSGLLSFAFHELLSSPEAYRKARDEVDRVVGSGPITVEHMSQLPYLEAVLRETLRLSAPIALYTVEAQDDTEINGWDGKYSIPKGQPVSLLLTKVHRDKRVYGDDSLEFKPERMLEDKFNKLPSGAWKPFGNGSRGCIGRGFAWQECLLIIAMILQNFDLFHFDPSQPVGIKQTLTLKPDKFFMRAIPRDGLNATDIQARLNGNVDGVSSRKSSDADSGVSGLNDKASVTQTGQPMTILYGSNSGTCENLAQRLASDAASHGFRATMLDVMDAGIDILPSKPANQPVIFITPSYEGKPADNAARFISWIEGLEDGSSCTLGGVQYAVFGCGHHDWASTFHKVPKFLDAKLELLGATRVAEMGLCDAARGKMFSDFETWEDKILWPALGKAFGISPSSTQGLCGGEQQSYTATPAQLDISVSSLRPSKLRHDVKQATVTHARRLTAEGEPAKQHLDIELPSGMTYRTGDYLAVLPYNPRENVDRAMRRFSLPWDASIAVNNHENGNSGSAIPTGSAVSVREVLSAYVELGDPATKRFEDTDLRLSVLDLLEIYTSVTLPLGVFLTMLPSMRVRQYSISSSPLLNPKRASITLSVLDSSSHHLCPDGPTDTTTIRHNHLGVASTYLASLCPGDPIHVSVRSSHAAFHLPAHPHATPIICVAAGSGLAPFRGFLEERAAIMGVSHSIAATAESGSTGEQQAKLAPAVLYYGCRGPGLDDIYASELAAWEAQGVVSIRWAYSRCPEKGFGGRSRYVQDAMAADRENVLELWREKGAKMYICGSRKVGDGVRRMAIKAYVDVVGKERAGEEILTGDEDMTGLRSDEELQAEAEKWWEGLRNTRYATDVFD
ncbi:cytochrome P450 [Microdochium trichocladiopsis]|uniref:Bifunctional cytochrome P450/NADPH--P450 reductase n=1 Tax=Microdochium trichocladiopsis TaxID=1682393 RepID=A0A9P8YIE9_9PEZI|nr:cytochrome P450 [Microdochium trichocladiopsis]KAH7039871.1 cytochrome P450 [Microdochium trichocladiopsis]